MRLCDAVIAFTVAVACFLLYLRTLAPGVVEADGGELQFAAWNFSFAHPTGYPLFLILGGLVQHLLPVGDPAYRLNVFTALTAALAVAMLYLGLQELTHRRIAAIVGAFSFALTRIFWFDAGAAEVYDLNALFLALLVFLALRWQASPDARLFSAFCFVYGLALTHHRTIILWAPAFGIFFAMAAARRIVGNESPSDSPLARGRETATGSPLASGGELSSGSRSESPSSSPLLRGRKAPSGSSLLRGRRVGGVADHVLGGWSSLALPAILLFMLPFLLYLYIPLRAPASPYAVLPLAPNRELVLYDNSVGGLLNYVFGRAFQNEIGWDATSVARLTSLPPSFLEQFGFIGIAVGLVGLGVMTARKEWARLALLLAGAIASVLFASLYHIGDIAHYYIPAYLAWAMWIGVGLGQVRSLLDRRKTTLADEGRLDRAQGRLQTKDERRIEVGGRMPVITGLLTLIVATVLLVPQFAANYAAADRSRETQAREQWDRILSQPIPPNAVLLSNDRDEMMPLWYIQYVENKRRDLLGLFPLITPAPEHANIVRLTDSLLDVSRPLFLIKPMPGLEIKYRLADADAPLVRVVGRATDVPPRFPSSAVMGERVRVIGYDAVRQGENLRVAIYWQPVNRLEYNYTTFVHVVDEGGQKVAQGIDHAVGGEFYPTMMWEAGEVLRDEQAIALPAGLAPKQYHLMAGMYRQPDMELLGEPAEIGAVDLR